jgi:hypothetical protein
MATAFEWRVDFYSGGTWYTLPSVQALNIFRGRRLQIDDYSADSMTVESEFPSSWTVAPKLGDRVVAYIYKPGVVSGMDHFGAFYGNIRDVQIDYGYVTNEDRVTITCEGLQGDWGRAQLNSFALVEEVTSDQVFKVGVEVGLPIAPFNGRSIASAQTYTGNAFGLINTITRTEEARMLAQSVTYHATPEIYWYGRNSLPQTTYYWNDGTGTGDPYQMKYEQIQFRSSADNYYTSVTIAPLSVASQTSTTGVTPIYGQNKDTVDYSTSQALNHAEWVLNNFQSKDQTIASVTFTDVQQVAAIYPPPNNFNVQVITLIMSPIATLGNVSFRGDNFNTILEGMSISATPEQTRCTVYMSGQDTNAYLILNDAIFGTLDNNKLGF